MHVSHFEDSIQLYRGLKNIYNVKYHHTLCANLNCCALKPAAGRNFEAVDDRTEARALEVNARCILEDL